MSIILQSIPCLFGEKITVFIRETINTNGYTKDLPPVSFDFPVLIRAGFNVETKVVILIDGSGSFEVNRVIEPIERFALENEQFMFMGLGSEVSISGSSGSSGSDSDTIYGIDGIDVYSTESYLVEIANRLSPTESRIIFIFQDESTPYGNDDVIDKDLDYLRAAYKSAAPSYVHVFAVGTYMIDQLTYAWSKPPIEGNGWTWGVYSYEDDFFTLLNKRFTSILQNQSALAFSIPLILKNVDLETVLGEKPFLVRIWALSWEYLAELRADDSNKLIENRLIPALLYNIPVYEHNSRHPLTVTHLCGSICCPPGCCMIRVRDQFCCAS